MAQRGHLACARFMASAGRGRGDMEAWLTPMLSIHAFDPNPVLSQMLAQAVPTRVSGGGDKADSTHRDEVGGDQVGVGGLWCWGMGGVKGLTRD